MEAEPATSEESESDDQEDQSSDKPPEKGEESDVTAVQFFTAASPSTARHRWLVLFYEYLSRPTAGDKKRAIRLQHASQMRLLLESVDPNGDDILCLLEDEGDAVWKRWVKPHLTNGTKKPGTIISYLTSYEKFLGFVTHERFNKSAPAVHPDYMARFNTLQKDIKGWRSCVDSQTYHLKNKRMVDETEGLLTLDELTRIKSSKVYNNAQRLLIEAGRGKQLTTKEFVNVRDFLLTKFSLDTGTRPGPLNNATLREYTSGKVQDHCKVMLVAKHKRSKDGPAICPMLPDQYKFMDIYVKRIRPDFAKSDEDALFVTTDGIAFREGTIGKRLSAFIEKCGVNLGSRMAFVDMRKVITTQMLDRCSEEERAILRRVLAHSEKTSRQWYARPDLTNTGIKAVNIIQRLLDAKEQAKSVVPASRVEEQSPSTSSSEEEGPAASTEKQSPPASPEEQSPPASPPPSKSKRPVDTQSGLSTKSSEQSTLASGVVPPSPSHKVLTDKQKTNIKNAFSKTIEAGAKVTQTEAQRTLQRVSSLSILSFSKKRVKQVVNYVNYLSKMNAATSKPPASEASKEEKVSDWLDKFDDPSSRSSKGRRIEWDDEDVELLKEAFQKFSALPHTTQIRTVINGDLRLQDLMDREGWARIYNKLKNLFRKKK